MSVSTIGVVGAGVMGSGIAQVAARKGIDVILLDVGEKAVTTGIDAGERRLSAVVTKGKITPAEKDAALRGIKGTTGYDALEPADVIIEAATEDYDLKARILKQVDARVSADPIIASNTSSVSITKLASSISHPARHLGTADWFVAQRTSPETGGLRSSPDALSCRPSLLCRRLRHWAEPEAHGAPSGGRSRDPRRWTHVGDAVAKLHALRYPFAAIDSRPCLSRSVRTRARLPSASCGQCFAERILGRSRRHQAAERDFLGGGNR